MAVYIKNISNNYYEIVFNTLPDRSKSSTLLISGQDLLEAGCQNKLMDSNGENTIHVHVSRALLAMKTLVTHFSSVDKSLKDVLCLRMEESLQYDVRQARVSHLNTFLEPFVYLNRMSLVKLLLNCYYMHILIYDKPFERNTNVLD